MKNNSLDFTSPLKLNNLNGRIINLPSKIVAKNNINIVFIYGHHSSLERWWGLIQSLSRYGNVIAPDIPGFGGMESFYKINKKPTIDNYADYLADFVNGLNINNKLIITGLSFGFVVATRMLQRHPELINKVTLLVSIVGFADKKDFTFSKPRYYIYLYASLLFSRRPFSTFFRYVLINPILLRLVYAKSHNAKNKFNQAKDKVEFNKLMDVEINLWHNNDARTHMFTTAEFLRLDSGKLKVDIPVWHIAAEADHFFDNKLVEKHMRLIFNNFTSFMTPLKTHAPSVIADENEASILIPEDLHLLLNKI